MFVLTPHLSWFELINLVCWCHNSSCGFLRRVWVRRARKKKRKKVKILQFITVSGLKAYQKGFRKPSWIVWEMRFGKVNKNYDKFSSHFFHFFELNSSPHISERRRQYRATTRKDESKRGEISVFSRQPSYCCLWAAQQAATMSKKLLRALLSNGWRWAVLFSPFLGGIKTVFSRSLFYILINGFANTFDIRAISQMAAAAAARSRRGEHTQPCRLRSWQIPEKKKNFTAQCARERREEVDVDKIWVSHRASTGQSEMSFSLHEKLLYFVDSC